MTISSILADILLLHHPSASRLLFWQRSQGFRYPYDALKRRLGNLPLYYLVYGNGCGGTRTPDKLLRRQLLYPAELRTHRKRGKFSDLEIDKGYRLCYRSIFLKHQRREETMSTIEDNIDNKNRQ
jgi:hypothetical protein